MSCFKCHPYSEEACNGMCKLANTCGCQGGFGRCIGCECFCEECKGHKFAGYDFLNECKCCRRRYPIISRICRSCNKWHVVLIAQFTIPLFTCQECKNQKNKNVTLLLAARKYNSDENCNIKKLPNEIFRYICDYV